MPKAAKKVKVPSGSILLKKFAKSVGKPYPTLYRWAREGWMAAIAVGRGTRQERFWVTPAEAKRVAAIIEAGGTLAPPRSDRDDVKE